MTASRTVALHALRVMAVAAAGVLSAARADAQADAQLVDAVLELDRAALAAEQRLGHPALTGLSVYVGSGAEDLLLRRVSLRIDDEPALTYEYGADQSDALRANGLHRLLSTPLAPGPHRLRIELIARHVDARPQTPRVRALLDHRFDKTGDARALEVTLGDGGIVGDPEVHVRAAVEPQLREADFLLATQAPVAAAHALTELQLSGAAVPADAIALRQANAMQALGRGLRASPVDDERAIYARYNRAVEQARSGALDVAITMLDEIGRIELEDIESRAMRDRANVTLGYLLLQHHRGAEALPVFQRVRSPGPYGNPGLLGLGWAYLTPTGVDSAVDAVGATQWVAGADEATAQRRRRPPFRYSWSVAAGEREQDVRKALAAWNELSGRDTFEPAVQEGLLAVPYALDHIGAHEQAQRRQLQAIETLDQVRAALDAALADVRSGAMQAAIDDRTADGWRRRLADLPYDEPTAYFRILSGDGGFLDALDTQRLLSELDGLLDRHQHRLAELGTTAEPLAARAAQLRARVDVQLQQQRLALADAAASVLQARRRETDRYLAEARFALAGAHDPSARALARAPADGGGR